MNCIVCATDIHDVFYTSVDHQGAIDTYCYGCYSRAVIDNYPGMHQPEGTKLVKPVCECGTKAIAGAGHSGWCPLFRKEFK